MHELAFLPATEQARLVRERHVSPVELVETYLERIERLDPELGAFVTVRAAQGRAKEVHSFMWIASFAFLLYFLVPFLQDTFDWI